MQYKISFLDKNGNEFLGTTEHFVTDGRYNFDTIYDIAVQTKNMSLKSDSITGYVIRKNSFLGNVIKKVEF